MAPSPARWHGLDLLRAVAMLLGLYIHAAHIYLEPGLMGSELEQLVPAAADATLLVFAYIHAWRMPLFFLLAGFFARLVLMRRGPGHFARDRAARIVLPLLLIMPAYNMVADLEPIFLGHFWFLYYLALWCVIAAVATPAAAKVAWPGWAARALAWTAARPGRLVCLLPLFVMLGLEREDGLWSTPPEHPSDIALLPFMFYGAWFLLGMAIHAHDAILRQLTGTATLMTTGVLSVVLLLAALTVGGHIDDASTARWVLAFLGTACTGVACCFFLGLAQRLLSQANKVVDWLVELAYPVYLIHPLFAYMFAYVLVDWGVNQFLALVANIMLTFVCSVVVYYVLFKFTPLNWIVNGQRHSWLKLPAFVAANRPQP